MELSEGYYDKVKFHKIRAKAAFSLIFLILTSQQVLLFTAFGICPVKPNTIIHTTKINSVDLISVELSKYEQETNKSQIF